jgi:hypothetical protein
MEGLTNNLSLAWTGDFDSLKTFIKEVLKFNGEWSQPGGDKKHFVFGNSSISWRRNKHLLSVNGEKSNEIRMEICKLMFKDSLPLETSPSQPQPSVSTHEYLIEIENLKESQRINNESIQFLADSISQISSTISHLQASNISNHDLTKEKPESSRQDQYPDCPSLDRSIVHSQSPSSITFSKDNNNEHNNDLRKSESSHDKNQVIDLTESTSVLPHLDPLQKLPYAKVVQANSQSQSPATDTPDLVTKPAEKVKTKENIPAKPPASLPQSSDGFIGVERKKRRNYKHFFLSGIAENVNEDQIYSYLVERNVTPNNITIFQSKRVGTISAKIRIPLASSPIVLQENFWPKYVFCKPWLQKPKESERRSATQENGKTLMGINATFV